MGNTWAFSRSQSSHSKIPLLVFFVNPQKTLRSPYYLIGSDSHNSGKNHQSGRRQDHKKGIEKIVSRRFGSVNKSWQIQI